MLGGPEFFVLLIAIPMAATYAAFEGYRCGYQNITIPKTILRGYFRGTVATSLGAYLAISAVAFFAAMGRGGGPEMLRTLSSGLIIAPVIGLITSLIPAPIAAFIAYNFGARKRAEEELARISLPPQGPR